ncbi:hypothetical protein [Lysinibacillus sp. fls2-241-R2A-57]|uniref:hypothetical protein n=1 Tax=Lysinibacillus sp. fls2-241-R2A-57 TaxID=3040292 RepID=UPI0025530528|nr:hypothetical protein [Lysinibacillus sp. fls2-241-R2A-57]
MENTERLVTPVSPGYYHAYQLDKLGDRKFFSREEIDGVMKEKGTTVSVDKGGKIKCPG